MRIAKSFLHPTPKKRAKDYYYLQIEVRKCFIQRRIQHILFTVIWRRTCGKGNSDMTEESRCRHYMGYSFRLPQGFFYMHHPTVRIIHTTAFVIPVVERRIAQWVHHEGSTRRPIVPSTDDLQRSYVSLPVFGYVGNR